MAKGDQIRVLLDTGNGAALEQFIVADKAGRSVKFNREDRKNLIEVLVEGRAGGIVRRAEYRSDRVLLIEEIPA